MKKFELPEVNTEQNSDSLLPLALSVSVPFIIEDLLEKGGPSDFDRERAAAAGDIIAGQADQLMYRTRHKKGDSHCLGTAEVFNQMAFGMAVLSFSPGGVTFMGLHFESVAPELETVAA